MNMHPHRGLWPSLLSPDDRDRDDLCLVAADGMRVRFADGHEALCATSGLWNANLGYGNEAIAEAGARALRDASYLSVFRYSNSYARQAADALLSLPGAEHYSRVLFSTSGGAANDVVIKLARHASTLSGKVDRRIVVGLLGSYHGLTYGGFSLTGENLGQQLYGVDPRFVRHVSPNAVDELMDLFEREGPRIAAVVVEPVLGTGTVELAQDYLQSLVALRDRWGFLLIADEVATGFGRTGPMFASSTWPGRPDVLIASKGMTNGTSAAAAILVAGHVVERFDRQQHILIHAETQAGTPVSCATTLATIAEFTRLEALATGAQAANILDASLGQLQRRLPAPTSLSGRGLFRTLHVRDPDMPRQRIPDSGVAALVAAIRRAGAVVHPGPSGIQLVPALTYTSTEVGELMNCLAEGFEEVARRGDLSTADNNAAGLQEAS